MYKVVPLHHGKSTRDKENCFTGWADVDPTQVASSCRAHEDIVCAAQVVLVSQGRA